MSLRNVASHSSRRPRAGAAAAAAMETDMESEQDNNEVSTPKAESSTRGREPEQSTPMSSRSKSMKRSKSTVKLNEGGKRTHRGKSTNRKEYREEARMLKVVDNLATEIEDRDKKIEDLEAVLQALKISSTATEASLNDAQNIIAEQAKEHGTRLADELKCLNDMKGRVIGMKLLDSERSARMKQLQEEKEKAETDLKLSTRERMNMEEKNEREVNDLQKRLDSKSRLLEVSKTKQSEVEERETSLIKERDAAVTKKKQLHKEVNKIKTEFGKVKTEVSNLKKAARPVTRFVVICVDGSGSLKRVLGQVKQVYRDLILYLKANCADAKVAVILHGCDNKVHKAHTISEWSLTLINNIGSPSSEDYSYCLPEAQKVLEKDACSSKVVVMIGDGEANYGIWSKLNNAMKFLAYEGIPAHSIVVPNGGGHVNGTKYSMQQISRGTGGRTETQTSYFSALDDFVGGK